MDEFTTPFLPDATKLALKVGAQKVEAGLSISRGEKCRKWILVLESRDLIRAAQFGISLWFLIWLAAVDCPSLMERSHCFGFAVDATSTSATR